MLLNTTENSKGIITLGAEVMVSDPCYGLGTWCQGILTNVLPGDYECFVEHADEGDWGLRVSRICVMHTDYRDMFITYDLEDITVGVDSGQAGIYDYDYYKQYHTDSSESEHVDEAWYDRVGDLTYTRVKNPNYRSFDVNPDDPEFLTKYREYMESSNSVAYVGEFDANTIDGKAFVSSSGYGDGSYECWTSRNRDGQIIAIMIDYLPEYDDEEEEDF